MSEAARRLSIPVGRLKNWVNATRAGKLKELGKAQKALQPAAAETAAYRGACVKRARSPAMGSKRGRVA